MELTEVPRAGHVHQSNPRHQLGKSIAPPFSGLSESAGVGASDAARAPDARGRRRMLNGGALLGPLVGRRRLHSGTPCRLNGKPAIDASAAVGAFSIDLTSSTISAGALDGEPASKGGWGSYSIASCTAWAISVPYMRARRVRPMSMPLDTPAAVI